MSTESRIPVRSPDGHSGNSTRRRILTSGELIGDAGELTIEHAGETYRLRVTSKGKLILTK